MRPDIFHIKRDTTCDADSRRLARAGIWAASIIGIAAIVVSVIFGLATLPPKAPA
jgi:hypothetical protein